MAFFCPSLFEEKRGDIEFGVAAVPLQVTPPQFYADSFEPLQVFRSWSEDVHIAWIESSDYFLSLFSQNELSHFPDKSE